MNDCHSREGGCFRSLKTVFEVVVIPAKAGIQCVLMKNGSPIKTLGDDNLTSETGSSAGMTIFILLEKQVFVFQEMPAYLQNDLRTKIISKNFFVHFQVHPQKFCFDRRSSIF